MFKVGRPPDYTEIDSYPFKRWLNSLYQFIQTITTLKTTTASYTVEETIFYVRGDASGGAITITIPLAATRDGRRILVKKVDSSGTAVTVSRSGSDTFEGSNTVSLAAQWDKVHLISNGNNGWEKL